MVEPKLIVNEAIKVPEPKDYDRFDPIAEFQKFYSDREKTLSPDVIEAFKNLYMEFSDASN
jgi:exonuclease SbcD